MRPSEFSDFKAFPAIQRFVKDVVDMQFADVRAMLKCPGFIFSAVAILCNLISGISVVLYTPSACTLKRGKRFKELLIIFYPWESNKNKIDKSNVIYSIIRNPLTHSLGVLDGDVKYRVFIKKSEKPLSEEQIMEIEMSDARPKWVQQAVTGDFPKYNIIVEGLYWGVFHLLKRLSGDTTQMKKAEKRIREGNITNR